jgi:hypothetical protein
MHRHSADRSKELNMAQQQEKPNILVMESSPAGARH